MAIKFEDTRFGEVVINGEKYGDILVIEDEVIPRDKSLLHKVFGTDHRIADKEVEKLLEGEPEVIVIGTGQSGILEVTEDVRRRLKESGVEVEISETPIAITKFNEACNLGKKVNALIHTTC